MLRSLKKKVLIVVIVIIFLFFSTLFAKHYKGAELRTNSTFTYGRFEVNYKSSQGAGQTSTFFTYHELGAGGVADWNEIDIEILGRYDNDVQFNTITPGQSGHEYHCHAGFDPSADYHTYAFEWTPDYVAWFVEGEEVYRQTGDHIDQLDKPQKLMMNIWPPVYSDWVGELDIRKLPFFAYYDWVSYSSHTPGEGDCGTGNNFSLQWKDEFETWDQSRWSKATHTWDGNNCDFIHDNSVFSDGKMILCLTDNDNTGYVDQNPPFVEWGVYNGDSFVLQFSEEVNKEDAEDISNYTFLGGDITLISALLLENSRTVNLHITGVDTSINYSVFIRGIYDISSTPNKMAGKTLNLLMPEFYNYPIKINVGGDRYGEFLADQEWSAEVDYGYLAGNAGHTNASIDGTDDDVIFQDEQYDLVGYKVRVPSGIYNVKLMFAENYFNSSGQRIFDVNLEGEYVARNLDIFSLVGNNCAYEIDTENIDVSDGIIDVHFGASKDNALFNGIVIEQLSVNSLNEGSLLPGDFKLKQNYPNPFNPTTMINYRLSRGADVTLNIYDIKGREVDEIVNQKQKEGDYFVKWQPEVPSGIYVCRLKARTLGNIFFDHKKMLFLK